VVVRVKSQILLVDDAASLIDLFGRAITLELGHEVTVVNSVAQVALLWDSPKRKTSAARSPRTAETQRSSEQTRDHRCDLAFDLAIVDLAFPAENDTGLSALYEIHRRSPETRLGILTQGDHWTEAILRDAWDLMPIKLILSKSAGLQFQLSQIQSVLIRGHIEVDPGLRVLLPSHRNPWRTPHNFSRLILHQGHVKMWRALLEIGEFPTYLGVAEHSGLSVNTVKNYRAQLLGELALHGVRSPGLSEMGEFAQRCRAFLLPFLYD
jgi:DNA-binding NarL/FixJ family response regulator